MNSTDITNRLAERICTLRKAGGMTQEALAEKLSVTFQAVSKWENGLSSPDICLLPGLADIFSVSVDALLGRPERRADCMPLPWENDGTLRAAVFRGHSVLESYDELPHEITFVYQGEAQNVQSGLSIRCGDIRGNATAGGGIRCGNDRGTANSAVGGNATAGGGINCGSVHGGAKAGGGINCGSVQGDVKAGGGVNCGSVHGGSVSSGGSVNCGSIHTEGGSVEAKNNLSCGDINCGELRVGGDVKCRKIKADRSEIRGKIICDTTGSATEYMVKPENQPSGNGRTYETSDDGAGEDDVMLDRAIKLVVEQGIASTSFLQRRLKLGYPHAVRIMNMMEKRDIVTPYEGTIPRKVLISEQQYQQMRYRSENLTE